MKKSIDGIFPPVKKPATKRETTSFSIAPTETKPLKIQKAPTISWVYKMLGSLILVALGIISAIIINHKQPETTDPAPVVTIQEKKEVPPTDRKVVKAQKEFEENGGVDGGRGAVYDVPHGSYDDFKRAVFGRGYDIDNYYGYQCWDGVALLYQQDGRNFSTGGSGMAKGTYISENGGGNFELIPVDKANRGDIIIFSTGRFGHVGFLDSKYGSKVSVLGQNQNGDGSGSPFSVITMSTRQALGAIRYLPWKTVPEDTKTSNDKTVIVKKGDTLGQIILDNGLDIKNGLFGDEGMAQMIAELNRLKNRGLIYPDEKLNLSN